MFLLAGGACELKGNQGSALSIINPKDDIGASRPPLECFLPTGGLGGSGPVQVIEDPVCNMNWDRQCAFPGVQDPATFVYPELTGDAMPSGSGGEIASGTYQLESFVEYADTSHCLISSGMRRSQVLRIGSRHGWLEDEDNRYLHWPMTFRYSTAGVSIDVLIACRTLGGITNVPYGPFGPFETYTATTTHLRLFSAACHYQASFRRIGP
ncbi:MAG TPA: hypothetical protein VFH73_04400 [Polyangia bacterium]|nr:hypothetical protein [Polyangia bacterium]